MPGPGVVSGMSLLSPASHGTAPIDLYSQQLNALGNQTQQQLQLGKQAGGYGLQQANIAAGASKYGSQQAAEAQKYGANTQLQAIQAQLAQSQGRFNQLFPYFQGAYGQISGMAGGGGGYGGAGGGQSTLTPYEASQRAGTGSVGNYGYGTAQAPPVAAPPSTGSLAPAISGNQLQANINLNNAQNWAQAGGQSRRQAQQLAGGGLGATSPLARALQAQTFGGALQANQAGATNAQMQAAGLNAEQARAAYQAQLGARASMYGSQVGAQAAQYGSQAAQQASMYGSNLDYQAALAQIAGQRQNALLQALSNFAA